MTQGTYYIYKPFLSILGASTLDWLVSNSTESDIGGGFLPRWLFFNATRKDYVMSVPDGPTADQSDVMMSQLRRLVDHHADIDLTMGSEAFNLYWHWRSGIEKNNAADKAVLSWVNRLGIYCLKVALIYEASTTEKLEEISAASMQSAMRLIDKLLADLKEMLKSVNFTQDSKDINKVRDIIKKGGVNGIEHSKGLKASKLKKGGFDQIIATLEDSGEIVVIPLEAGGNGKTSKKYVYVI